MIASGPGGSLPPIRTTQDSQPAATAAKTLTAPSGLGEEARPATRAETLRAVDPARQAAAAMALPRDETNDRARSTRGLVEPDRASAAMLAADTPTEATPAGPPPTFDVSILEKARAVAKAPPPLPPPAPTMPGSEEADAGFTSLRETPAPAQGDLTIVRVEEREAAETEQAPGDAKATEARSATSGAKQETDTGEGAD